MTWFRIQLRAVAMALGTQLPVPHSCTQAVKRQAAPMSRHAPRATVPASCYPPTSTVPSTLYNRVSVASRGLARVFSVVGLVSSCVSCVSWQVRARFAFGWPSMSHTLASVPSP